MATTLGSPDNIKTSRMSVQLSSLKEVIRPKNLSPDVFTPLMEQWLKRKQPLPPRALGEDRSIPRTPRPKPDKESADKYSQVENGLMSLLPIKEEQLAKIPSLLPDLTSKFKPTTMSFGWVIGLAEIEQLGRMKGEYMTTRPILHCYEPGDPDCPQDAEFEDGVCEVLGEHLEKR
ncbi:hypothetical protein BC629DRAFT_1435292 [Irpex lacteus]|nr:hypothetical protein BC629DRAFT_1435292 [Irpex lacteus]